MHKITIALEVHSDDQRDELLREIQGLLLRTRIVRGKVTHKRTVDIVPGEPLDIAALGVDDAEPATPIERMLGGVQFGRG